MKYLLFLNKFELDKERLKQKIKAESVKEEIGRLIVDSKNDISEELLGMQEVKKIYEIVEDWKELNFKTLKKNSLKAVKNYKTLIHSYIIETRFLDKIPISAKSIYKHINPYLKHEGLIVDEKNAEVILYIEFKKENNKRFYRLCIRENTINNKEIDVNFSNLYAVLEEPRLVEEVSDFLRLCWIFRMPLFILTKDRERVEKLLKKAKEITKGIDYNNLFLKFIPHLSKDFIKVGFTKHAKNNETDLINFFKENEDSKICLIFGNDTYGLSQEVRDDLNYSFRLTPELKKPLKANQALSYVLGIYAGMNLY